MLSGYSDYWQRAFSAVWRSAQICCYDPNVNPSSDGNGAIGLKQGRPLLIFPEGTDGSTATSGVQELRDPSL
jgi:hypothetical protein